MSADRQATLKRLLRAIALSFGDFALLLARCNSIEVRDRLVADLKAQLGSGLYDRHITDADGVVNLVDILDEVGEGTQVISVTGLEASPHLHDILALANNAREEFRKRFKFPLVLWVTDEVEAELRRRSPDLASWAAPPFDFALDRAELQAMLERETADVLDWAFAREGKRGIGQELQWAWQEWQRLEENRSPELAARVALAFGIEAGSGEAARVHFENCLAQVSTGSLAAAARYRLGLWWQLRGKQERVNFLVNCDRAREQLQMAWQEPEGKQASVALALGEILLALALPETGNAALAQTGWQALANFANELVILPDWAAGLRAEVAIARQDWQVAKAEAEKALQGQERQGFHLLSLGQSLIGMNLAKEAIAPLEQAKALVLPEVDPDLHIRILQALHRAYTAVGNYRDAFTVKCDRESVETSYGFRAFIGAGRLQPQRRVGAIGEDAMEEVAASGRQADIEALVDRVKRSDCRLTVVHGPSGVGKSSLLQSGLVPALRKVIHQSRSVQPVVIEHYEDWQGELANKFKVSDELTDLSVNSSDTLIAQLHDRDRQNLITVLIFDQFEEFFFKHTDVPDRRKLYDFLRECLAVPYVWVILSLREDYIHYLLECARLANIELINNDILNKNVRYYLGNFSKERAKAVIKELTERSPYRLEEALVDRLVADLAAELGEVRPIELQVVGAQMLHGESKITTLAAYEGLGNNPKRALVEGWLMQVVRDCGQENEELAQRVLYALTEEPEKRPKKTKTELRREVRLESSELLEEERDLVVRGDLDFVLRALLGAGLAFDIPASPEVSYQLIHDYLVKPIRQQFGGELEKRLEDERQKRKQAEASLQKRNKWLLQGSLIAALVMAGLSLVAVGFALESKNQEKIAKQEKEKADAQTLIAKQQKEEAEKQTKLAKTQEGIANDQKLEANKARDSEKTAREKEEERRKEAEQAKQNELAQRQIAEQKAEIARRAEAEAKEFAQKSKLDTLNAEAVVDSLYWKGLMDAELFNLEEQVATVAKGKEWVKSLDDLRGDTRLEIISTVFRASNIRKEKARFQGHQSEVSSIAFSPDGKSIVTDSVDNTAKLWSIDGRLLQTFQGHQSSISSVAFSPDGKSIVTGSGDKSAKLWSIDGRLLQTFQGHQNSVTSVAFSPDGKSIVTGGDTAKLWSIDGRLLQTFQEHKSYISSVVFDPYSVAFSRDGKSIVTGRGDTAKLWSLDGRLLQTFQGHQSSIYSVAFSPDGKSIVTGSFDKTAKLWSLDGLLLQTFQGHQNSVTSVAFAPDGKSIVTSSFDKTVKLWSLDGHLLQTFQRNKNFTTSVAFAPDGKSFVTGSGDTVKLWSLDGRLLQTFQGHQSEVSSATFTPDGKSIVTTGIRGDNTAKLWSIDGRLLQTFQGHQSEVSSVAFSPDGKSIVTGSGDTLKLWSIDGRLLQTFQGHQGYVSSVAFSPDGESIVTGSGDETAKLWSIDGRLLQTFQGHQYYVTSVAFAPDGKSIVTGSADRTAKLWNLDGRLLQTFQGHQARVTSVAFAPDGKSIVTGSVDKSAKLWNLDGRLLQTFQGHQSEVYRVAFAPDGKSIVTGSGDNTVKLWDLDLGHSLTAMCDHLHDFASLSNDLNIPEEDRNLRQRAKTACEGIPPPKTSLNFLKNGNLTLLSSIFINQRD
jgi:WD40 repeat protein